jgi:transcription-repair coupling factor (superfamily II helicase)
VTLLDTLCGDAAHARWLDALKRPGARADLSAPLPAGAHALLASLLVACGRTVLLIGRDPASLAVDCRRWLGGASACHAFPEWGGSASDRQTPPAQVRAERLRAASAFALGGPVVVCASPPSLLQPTLSPDALRSGTLRLEPRLHLPPDEAVARLVAMGYERQPLAEESGQFALRGGILDVFPLDAAFPVRAEWFGDDIDSLRTFHPENQRTILPSRGETILPSRELPGDPHALTALAESLRALNLNACRADVRALFTHDLDAIATGTLPEGAELYARLSHGTSTLLEHLPPDAVILEFVGLDSATGWVERQTEVARGEMDEGELPPDLPLPLFSLEDARVAMAQRTTAQVGEGLELGYREPETFAGRPDHLAEVLRDSGLLTVLRTGQEQRLRSLLANRGMDPPEAELTLAGERPASGCVIDGRDAASGFVHEGLGLRVLGDHELFGRAPVRARAARPAPKRISDAVDLHPGDLVVHTDHGIGRFLGMSVMEVDAAEREYLLLEYAGGDRVYVPVEYLDRIQRYIGGADTQPSLSKLGGAEWGTTKRKVREDVEVVARDLLQLYARRAAAGGHAFAPDSPWQGELEESFPFQETPDQLQAMAEIKSDMERGESMDRLLCGDVGFGKTELAVRAAFKAVMDGRQVAVLVPTTVLAQQHYYTFRDRLKAFPVKVAMLSRFSTADEERDAVRGLRTGDVDIVIGTHRVIASDVKFKDLGLVVIDEEHRFGVMQKERLKRLRAEVDVLSMSATPIPRTLHMALAGVRDMSVIATPPEGRLPVRTYVTADDDALVREVLRRELRRGGQVYYLHNRVRTIKKAADRVRSLVPEARIAIAHGQMDERELAATMVEFVAHEHDILVCTTIIESGIDNPNVNTIVIDDASHLGLAQLYQLRGRVGRGGVKAYAYFLYDPQRSLTETADKRLDVVSDLQDLGSGFKVALRDMEIRGAGSILGVEQHGAIAAVGFEMYARMLSDAVNVARGAPAHEELPEVTLALPVDHFLPHDYIEDERLRLQTYHELAEIENEVALDAADRELRDRFGEPPGPVVSLVWSLRVKILAAHAGIRGVALEAGSGITGEAARTGRAVERTLTLRFEDAVPAPLHRYGRVAGAKLRVDATRWGDAWQDRLVELLRDLGRTMAAAAAGEAAQSAALTS